MNRSVVHFLIAKMVQIEAILLLLPVLVGIIYGESIHQIGAYLMVAGALGLLSTLIAINKPVNFQVRTRDGIVSVALGWILMSLFGAIPFVLTQEIPSIVDAFFEVASGFTTTGSSIVTDLTVFAKSSLFWRSFTHLVGGMGILVFTLAIMPGGSDYVQLMRAEVPGPVFGKLVSKLKKTAQILYAIYLAMTCLLILVLWLFRVPLFDAMLLAFGTAGTGGFSVNPAGFAVYLHPHAVEWIIGVGMLLFGVNFNIYYFILIGYAKDILKKDEELKAYLMVVGIAVCLICINVFHMYPAFEPMVREVFFTVSSIITTTGYATADFDKWPLLSHVILVLLMFIGGCAGSTAGGLKVSRVVMYTKSAFAELKRAAQPRRKIVPLFSGKPITANVEAQVANYLIIYSMCFITLLLAVSIEAPDFATAFTSVAATFNNIGPGLGAVGPTQNFAFYSDVNKILLSLGMIAGRLEIFPIILLFSPKTLKNLAIGHS